MPPTTLNPETRLNKALDLHPQVLDYIVSLNPHDFQRLRNPFMRRMMSPRITLGRIAKMTGRPVAELLNRIATLSGAAVADDATAPVLPQSPDAQPDWLAAAEPDNIREVNLLPIDATLDADPMRPVAQALKQLAPGEVLLIRHKWEPQPFYDIWSKLDGVEWYAEQIATDEWHIWLRRTT